MKKSLIARQVLTLTVAVWLAWSAAAPRAQADEIYWFKDLEKASEAALKENKIMMVDFWADWCAACKVMDEDVYPDAEVHRAQVNCET